MVDGSLPHPATVAVEHADLMLLRAPINAHKPLVRQVMIVLLWMYGGLHDKAHRSLTSLIRIVLCGALPWLLFGPVLALAAQLPTGCAPRDTRWGTSPTEGLEAQGTYGTPSEVTRYDYCNRRLLRWYRAPTNIDPGANGTGAMAVSVPSTTSPIPCCIGASDHCRTGSLPPFCCVSPVRPDVLPGSWVSISGPATGGAGGCAMPPCPMRWSANWRARWKRMTSITPPVRRAKRHTAEKSTWDAARVGAARSVNQVGGTTTKIGQR